MFDSTYLLLIDRWLVAFVETKRTKNTRYKKSKKQEVIC